jgi:predicted nucleic acid-binding protein
MHYLDTSLVVAMVTREPRREDVYGWLESCAGEDMAISPWVVTELSSALSIKLRTGQLDLGARSQSLAAFQGLVSSAFHMLEFDTACFLTAARLTDHHGLGLRGADALHLAVASAHGATLCTLDRTQAAAGLAVGVSTKLI